MKDLKNVDVKELKVVVKELNDSGLIKKKISLVGIKNQDLLVAFTEALEALPEDSDVPQSIADFYNDLYADDIEQEMIEEGTEEVTEEEVTEEEVTEEEVTEDEVTEDSEEEDLEGPEEEGTTDEGAPEPTVKEKKKKTPPVVRSKGDAKKKTIGVEKRAEINPKLSLTKKVAGLLNFKDGRYKMTSYYPLDVETVRILEGNVGLYPTEILAAMRQDKKAVKRIEKFTETVLIREINKIKSAYAYIVGAIRDDRVNGKLRVIMTTLLAGKEVPPEIGHYTTVKIARRALLAYMEVVGIDHKTMSQVKDEMVEKAASKPAGKPAAKSTPVDRKKEAAKTTGKPAAKPAAKPTKK